jgi:hypothetical protein
LGRGHAQEDELGAHDGVGGTEHEAEAASVEALTHQLVEAGLDDGHLALLEHGDLLGDDVGTNDGMSEVSEHGAGGEADVARADDGDAHAVTSSLTRRSRGS